MTAAESCRRRINRSAGMTGQDRGQCGDRGAAKPVALGIAMELPRPRVPRSVVHSQLKY
jgi:hypothetical protein